MHVVQLVGVLDGLYIRGTNQTDRLARYLFLTVQKMRSVPERDDPPTT